MVVEYSTKVWLKRSLFFPFIIITRSFFSFVEFTENSYNKITYFPLAFKIKINFEICMYLLDSPHKLIKFLGMFWNNKNFV